MRVILVGLGQVGLRYDIGNTSNYLSHAKVLASMHEFELAAAVDPDPNARALFVATYDIPAFPSLDALYLSNVFEDIDLYIIATPTRTHYDVCIDILKNQQDLTILLEKPACEKNYQRQILLDLANKKNCRIYINTMRRCIELFENIKLENLSGARPLLSCYVIYPPDFWNNGIHAFDLLRYITGNHFHSQTKTNNLNRCFWGNMGKTRVIFSQSISSTSSIYLMQFEFESSYAVVDLFTGRVESYIASQLSFNHNYNIIDLGVKRYENTPRVDLQLRWYKKFVSTLDADRSWMTTLYDIIEYANCLEFVT